MTLRRILKAYTLTPTKEELRAAKKKAREVKKSKKYGSTFNDLVLFALLDATVFDEPEPDPNNPFEQLFKFCDEHFPKLSKRQCDRLVREVRKRMREAETL
jgi:hypothetical protein